jgi:multidrug resistance efflux pump
MPTRRIHLIVLLTIAASVHAALAQQPTPARTEQPSARDADSWSRKIVHPHFVVSLIDDTNVAAQEEGVLISLDKKEGQLVKKDDKLAQIDDSDAQIRRIIAENELKIAIEESNSDADLKAAQATVGVAQAEYDGSREIRDRSSDAISVFEVRRLKLTQERSEYQAANAEVQFRISQLTKTMREAQLSSVDREIERRTVRSPINGVVVRRFRNLGDWVKVGEPVYRVVRMDRLRVEGLLSAERFTPAQVEGRRVEIRIDVPDGKTRDGKETITLPSSVSVDATLLKVNFASPVVDASRDFLVFIEFDNQLDANGRWLVRPGLEAEVTIYLDSDTSNSTAGR